MNKRERKEEEREEKSVKNCGKGTHGVPEYDQQKRKKV
jgi:hypothetical protein